MLEGQVAVLSSGLLSAGEAADLLDALRASALYREDQRSYMLYPNRQRKSFLELNNLPEDAKQLPVVQKYIGSVLKQDDDGGIHFDARFRNADSLPDELKDLYEQVFNHHDTGRPSYEPPMLIDSMPVGCPQFSIGQSSYWLETPTEPLFPFGYGLSYTTFEYGSLHIDTLRSGKEYDISCTITNTGNFDA